MSAKHQVECLSIGLFGVNERSRKTLEVLFSVHAKGRYCLDESETPQVAIVDMDGADAEILWLDYRSRYPGLSTIVISFRGGEHPDAVSLKKPVTAQSLLDALAGFSHAKATSPLPDQGTAGTADAPTVSMDERHPESPLATESQKPELVVHIGNTAHPETARSATAALEETLADGDACGNAEDIDPRNPKRWPAVYYNPENHFQSACQQTMRKALQTGKIQLFALDGLEYPLVFLPEQGGQVVTQLSRNRLRFFCLVILNDIASAIAQLETLPPDLAQLPRIPFDRFMWDVTLWSSHGHLPDGTHPDVPLRLKCWPNFTRLTETPHAMTIAALWTRQPYSLLRTCQILGVPQRHVFGFYSAASAAGLVEWQSDHCESSAPLLGIEHQGEDDRRENSERRAHGDRRGLLRRILSHLLHS